MTAKRRAAGATVLVAVVVLLLSGCGSPTSGGPQSSAAPATASSEARTDAVLLASALRGALGRVDPGFDAQASVDDADNVCSYVKQGASEATLERQVRVRFAGRAERKLTAAKVAKTVKVIRVDYCERR